MHLTTRPGVLVALCLLLTITGTLGQDKGNITALAVGDKAPSVLLEHVMNAKDSTLALDSFKGRLVLLDFMSFYCSSCRKALDKLDSLQQQFSDKLQVVVITTNEQANLQGYLERNQLAARWHMPFVPKGSTLKQYYPHKIISHLVWIDAAGTTRAITGTAEVTAANIRTILANPVVNWPVKKDTPVNTPPLQ